jgi:sulfur-oxidizing protein SoxX
MRSIIVGALASVVLASCNNADDQPADNAAPIEDARDTPLVDASGDVAEGQRIFVSRERGHCIACHSVDGLGAEFQGDVGPPLSDVGARLTPGQIRFRIIDASRLNPDTLMPPYYRTEGLEQVEAAYRGKTILTAQEIEHVVAYLSSLKGDL